jgi:polyhydroxybutyrate depolymerase
MDDLGYLVVYPDAYEGRRGRRWNEGIAGPDPALDDVDFLSEMIDDIASRYRVDLDRVYMTGASNGGFMTNRFLAERSDRVRAGAPVIGGMSQVVYDAFQPTHPVSVLVIQNLADAWVPWEGGPLGDGHMMHTLETLEAWVSHIGGDFDNPSYEQIPNIDRWDGCRSERYDWDGALGERVSTIITAGAGHTWAGAPADFWSWLFFGNTSRDFWATWEILRFFGLV